MSLNTLYIRISYLCVYVCVCVCIYGFSKRVNF